MLKTINSSGKYLMVNGGMPAHTYVNTYSGSQGVGNVRFNTGSQNLEVYDGTSWIQISTSHASIGLTPDVEMLIDWAMEKRKQEIELEVLAQTNPTIADLVNQSKEIKEKIRVIQTLIKPEVTLP